MGCCRKRQCTLMFNRFVEAVRIDSGQLFCCLPDRECAGGMSLFQGIGVFFCVEFLPAANCRTIAAGREFLSGSPYPVSLSDRISNVFRSFRFSDRDYIFFE